MTEHDGLNVKLTDLVQCLGHSLGHSLSYADLSLGFFMWRVNKIIVSQVGPSLSGRQAKLRRSLVGIVRTLCLLHSPVFHLSNLKCRDT
jgi:hypothetical protein